MASQDEVKICGHELNQEVYMKAIWIIYELVVIICGGLITLTWYKNRKTFPLMERSPFLSIYFLFNVIIYLLSYPIFLQSRYLQQHENSLILKCIFIPFQASYTYIYLMKSCRLSWGFNISRTGCLKTVEKQINCFFANELYIVLFCFFILILQILTGIIPSEEYNQFDFMSINIENNDINILLTRVIENFIGLVFLLIAVLLVWKVDLRVSIIYELYVIIICDVITSYFRHMLMITNLDFANNFCFENIPLLYLINWIKLIITVIVGMVRPINMINREHQYYNSVLVREIGFFIFYREDIFSKYILYCQEQQSRLLQQNHQIQQNTFIPQQSNLSREQRNSHSPIFQSSKNDSQAQNEINASPLNMQIQQRQQSSPSQANLSQNESQNQNQSSSQQSSSMSNQLFGNRDAFYRTFNFEQVEGHYNIYLKSITLRNQLSTEEFESEFKNYFLELKSKGLIEKYFQQKELIYQINYWLKADSFNLSINKNEDQSHNILSSSCIGVLGTLYQSNQQSSEGSDQDNFVERKQLQNSKIIENILNYSQEQLTPCFNEYKMTNSFQIIQQNLQNMLKAYTNLLQINMAVDQNITID